MLRNNGITALQMYFVLTLSIGFSNHVVLIPVLLRIAKRDAWFGAVAALLPVIVWLCILVPIIRRIGNRKMTHWLRQQYGKPAALFVILVFGVYFILIAIVALRDTVVWTNVSYLERTPKAVITVAFMIPCFFAARAGLRAIAITAGLLLPFVVLFGLWVMSANFQYKDYSLLAPLFTHGYEPTFKSAMFVCGGIFELTVIMFMQHQVSTAIKFPALVWLSILLIELTVGPLTGAIALFGPFQAAEMRYPAFEQWRMVTMGKFISHLDFFSIYQWISGTFIRTSLMLNLTVDLLDIKQRRRKTIVLALLSVFITGITLNPLSDMSFFKLLSDWYYPLSLWVNLSAVALLFILAVLIGKGKEQRTT